MERKLTQARRRHTGNPCCSKGPVVMMCRFQDVDFPDWFNERNLTEREEQLGTNLQGQSESLARYRVNAQV